MKLFLIRHGETPWTVTRRYQGSTDVPLNRNGKKQAALLSKILKPEAPVKIYTSALKRAHETAQHIARPFGLEPVADERLNELHFGKWEGRSYVHLARTESRFQKWREGRLKKPPGGESLQGLARRVGKFFEELILRHREETIFIVAHGGPIKIFLLKALGGLKRPVRSLAPLWLFRIDPASVSLIEGTPRLFQIVFVNRTDHLKS